MVGSNYRGYAFSLILGVVLVTAFVWALNEGIRHGEAMDKLSFQKGCFSAILAADQPKVVRGSVICPKVYKQHVAETYGE